MRAARSRVSSAWRSRSACSTCRRLPADGPRLRAPDRRGVARHCVPETWSDLRSPAGAGARRTWPATSRRRSTAAEETEIHDSRFLAALGYPASHARVSAGLGASRRACAATAGALDRRSERALEHYLRRGTLATRIAAALARGARARGPRAGVSGALRLSCRRAGRSPRRGQALTMARGRARLLLTCEHGGNACRLNTGIAVRESTPPAAVPPGARHRRPGRGALSRSASWMRR